MSLGREHTCLFGGVKGCIYECEDEFEGHDAEEMYVPPFLRMEKKCVTIG